nr:molybdopterin-guanine dinucleotide biosynthesis protein B [Desulfuromonas sp.]
MTTPAVSFVAKSGTGKTTLLEKVVAELKRREYKVGTVKHGAHHFDIDHPGKDSFRMAAAGADTVLITSKDKLALIRKHRVEPPLKELIEAHFTDMDIVLVEGFKQNDLPKVEVHRQDRR